MNGAVYASRPSRDRAFGGHHTHCRVDVLYVIGCDDQEDAVLRLDAADLVEHTVKGKTLVLSQTLPTVKDCVEVFKEDNTRRG